MLAYEIFDNMCTVKIEVITPKTEVKYLTYLDFFQFGDKMLFTSESVTEGHPDKICDQISDAVLDEIYKQDPDARVACETLAKTGFVLLAGEITASAKVDFQQVARDTIKQIGYDNPEYGFDGNTCGVLNSISEQSRDIAQGVDNDGAGDQGMMFGYACNETPELMPLPINLAHKLTRKLAEARRNKLAYLRPDGKSQVTVEYQDGKPVRVDTVVIACQHSEDVSTEQLRQDIISKVIEPVCGDWLSDTKFHINATGRFVIGGPVGDAGMTGRKIIVDTYGGSSHGGGCFSGKDPSKVDRSGAYMARYIAKNIVAAGLAEKCEVQLAYSIGVAEPVSILVNTFGTGKLGEEKMAELVRENFPLTPTGIIKKLDLRRSIYKQTSVYGHFGRDEFPWEQIDMVEVLSGKS